MAFGNLISGLVGDVNRSFSAQEAEQVARDERARQAIAGGQTLNTALGGVQFGGINEELGTNFSDIDALIQARTPTATGLLAQGAGEQLRLSQLAQQAQTQPLEQFGDLGAQQEQNALLGLLGAGTQREALANIPQSAAALEGNRRQRQQLLRGAAATGDIGSGAALLAGQQLGAQQQLGAVQGRLADLEPLAALARGVRGQLSGFDEAARARQAEIQGGLGTQLSRIRLGSGAQAVQGIQDRAELQGIQGISAANQRSAQNQQLAQLAGTFAGSLNQTPTNAGPVIIPQQAGFTNPNVSPTPTMFQPNANFSPVSTIQF